MKHSMNEHAALRQAERDVPGAEPGPALPGPWRTVLELARWAPSGDNTQPWRFEVRSDSHMVVHCFDTRAESVYDLDGRPSRLSVGMMLETLRIAAAGSGLQARVERRAESDASALRFDVRLAPSLAGHCPELLPCIGTRSVQRRPLSRRALAADARAALEASVGPEHELVWLDSPAARRSVAALLYRSARIRLTTEEAYRTHARVLEWRATHSAYGIPDAAVGLDPV